MAYQNFFAAKLTTDIGASDTTITLDIAPTATSGRMVLEARNPTQREVIKYTGVAGNTITGVTRGQGGTSAKAHTKNSLIEMNLTSEDLQDLYDAFASFTASNTDWRNLPYPAVITGANGNKSYGAQIIGVDLTAVLSAGMRLRYTKSTPTQVQCTSLNGTSQYWNRASGFVAGMTFTDDFVVSAWVKVSSYATSMIASRYNGTSGWALNMQSTGQVQLVGVNGGAGNTSYVQSYQSIPLNKWVHVTAQLDMSAFTATTTTSYVMIDGVDVPSSVARGGTNPTALIQAGNLEIGSWNGGLLPFPGKIAQVAIYSAKVTQATILASMNQSLTGSETSIVAAYKFDGNGNDLTANANHLTANGGVVATDADAPFGNSGVSTTKEYAIIMTKPVYSAGNTTFTVQIPEGCVLPTSGSIASLDYSGVSVPYGFPRDKGRWEIEVLVKNGISTNSPTAGVFYDSKFQIIVPKGAFLVGFEASLYGYKPSASSGVQGGLQTSNSSLTDYDLFFACYGYNEASHFVKREKAYNLSSATPYYLIYGTFIASQTNVGINNDGSSARLLAKNAYL